MDDYCEVFNLLISEPRVTVMSVFPYVLTSPKITLMPGQMVYVEEPHHLLVSFRLFVSGGDVHEINIELIKRNKVNCPGAATTEPSPGDGQKFSFWVSLSRMMVDGLSCELDPSKKLELDDDTYQSSKFDEQYVGKEVQVVFTVHSVRLYNLKYSSSFLSLFSAEYFAKDSFTDCTVKCQEFLFHCHRCVLGKQSPAFASAFTSEGMVEAENSCITIDDYEPAVLRVFLMALYEPACAEILADDVM